MQKSKGSTLKLKSVKEPAKRRGRRAKTNAARRASRSASPIPQAIVLHQPIPSPVEFHSMIPAVAKTVQDMEQVRRFVSKALNRDLQRELEKLRQRTDLNPEQKAKEGAALHSRLEIDWGTIPGVDKPFLMQPGAEKFMLWLNLRPSYVKREVEMTGGHLEMICSVNVYHKKTGEIVFEGPDCSCSTMESNFRFRWAEMPKPPNDIADLKKAQKMGRNFKKKVYAHGKYTGEEWVWQERVENANIHDERNKVRQIGEKRALVKCIRNMGAISEIFTADPSEWDIPDEGGSPEDDMDFTPAGRRIYTENGSSPSGRYQAQAKPAGEARGPKPEPAAPPKEQPKPTLKPNKKVLVTFYPDKKEIAFLSGDAKDLLPFFEKVCPLMWFDTRNAYAVAEVFLAELHAICEKHGYEWSESSVPPPSGARSPSASVSGTVPAASKRAASPPQGQTQPPAGKPHTEREVSGTVKDVKSGITSQKKIPYMDVQLSGSWYKCYNRDLFEFFGAAKGQEATIVVNERQTIVGIRRIAAREFDVDGKTPVVQLNEERPRNTGELFR